MRQPNVLVLDIETAPIIAYLWDLKVNGGYVPFSQVKQDRYIMAVGVKWLGQSKMHYFDQKGLGPLQDKGLLMQLWPFLDKADIVISYNGESFDSKRITSRYMQHRIKPPSPYRHYDVMKLHKRVADHTSNTLDYVSTHTNVKFKKLHHDDFPGFSLWLGCMAENPKAWASMKKYNIHDVLSTEENAINTLAWAPECFPEFYPVSDRAMSCGRCGYFGHMRSIQSKLTNKNEFHQYRCSKCGGFQTGKKIKCGM